MIRITTCKQHHDGTAHGKATALVPDAVGAHAEGSANLLAMPVGPDHASPHSAWPGTL